MEFVPPIRAQEGLIPADALELIDRARQGIIAGTLVVPSIDFLEEEDPVFLRVTGVRGP